MFLFLTPGPAPVQLHFSIPNASPQFSAEIEISTSDDPKADSITGSATITVIRNANHQKLQSIKLDSIVLFKSQMCTYFVSSGKQPDVYDDAYSLVFADFNFDGNMDLAVCRNTDGSYSSPTYDIYRWRPSLNRFIKDAELTKLGSEHLGLIKVDFKKRELITYDKSGAAWHLESRYRWVKGRPLLVQSIEDDATSADKEVITTKTLVGGRWRKQVKVIPASP